MLKISCGKYPHSRGENYTLGLSSTDFKARLAVHTQTFNDEEGTSQTSLSKFIWKLKRKNTKHEVTWKILDRGATFSPISGKCGLCIKEKFYIMFRPESAGLNSKSEAFSACWHKSSKLLIPKPPKKKKKGPGWKLNYLKVKTIPCGLISELCINA